jgi:DNA-binding NarL/FixJ family response regulator
MEVLLSNQPDIERLARAESLAEARAQAARFEFDVAILDLGLPDGSGVDLIAGLRQSNPEVGGLILSASLDPAGIEKAARLGADEIMDKLAPIDEVLATVRRLGKAEAAPKRRGPFVPQPPGVHDGPALGHVTVGEAERPPPGR